MRLTDQALVAVALARRSAGATGRTPSVADLLAGLAAEPDGGAGRRLRARASTAVRLVESAGTPAPPLDGCIALAAAGAAPRPAWTLDLLAAARRTGGPDVADLLDADSYDLDGPRVGDPFRVWDDEAETFGLDPAGDQDLTGPAARVVAQVRAAAGGAVEVLLAVAAAPDAEAAELLPEPDELAIALVRLRDAGADATPGWDHGLVPVIEAAASLRAGDQTAARDLVAAAVVAGGSGPRRLLEDVRR